MDAKSTHRPKNTTNSHSAVKEDKNEMPSVSKRAGTRKTNEKARAETTADGSKLRRDHRHKSAVNSPAVDKANSAIEISPIDKAVNPESRPSLSKGVSYTAHRPSSQTHSQAAITPQKMSTTIRLAERLRMMPNEVEEKIHS